MEFIPHNYQKEAIDFLIKNRYAAIFADPGLGKTAIVLSLIKKFHKHPKFKGALIIAPLRVIYSVWPIEIQKWNQFNDLSFQILHGLNRLKALNKSADIYLLNVENIFWLFEYDWPFNLLIIDESSKFKSYSSKRFKLLKKFLDQFHRRIILTGTPIPNSMMDLYSQIFLLDKGKSLGRFITHYRQQYFYPMKYRNFIEWNLKPGADKVIQRRAAHLIQHIESENRLDLPSIIYNQIYIQLPPKIKKIYKQFEKQFFAQIDDMPYLINSAVNAYNICRQVANGCLYKSLFLSVAKPPKRKILALHSAKIEAIQELTEELQGKPVLIAYHYKHDLQQLFTKFGKDTPYLGGGISSKKSAKIVNDWNVKKIPILLGHPQSIAHGLNLQFGGHDIIWFSLTDNLENYLQFNRRIYRQGVTKQVRIHHILAEDTIDLAIMKRLKSKDKTQKALLDALKEYKNENKTYL